MNPASWIAEEIRAFRALHFQGRQTIGAHIRVGYPLIHTTKAKMTQFWNCALRTCKIHTPQNRAIFLSTANLKFARHRVNRSALLLGGCKIVTYQKPLTRRAAQLMQVGDGKTLMALIEMLLLASTLEIVAFMGPSYSQAAYAMQGVASINEHCQKERHAVPSDICAHYESMILWRAADRHASIPQGLWMAGPLNIMAHTSITAGSTYPRSII